MMNSEQIIRNFQLYLLSDIPLEEPYLSIYKDLKRLFSDLNIYISDNEYWSKYTYYGKSKNDLYIRYDEKNGDIWLDYTNIWSVFESKYGLSDKTIQGITTWSVANTLHLKGTTNYYHMEILVHLVANTLHLKGTTNETDLVVTPDLVANTLHLKGTTNLMSPRMK